jgi:hypothetical protein
MTEFFAPLYPPEDVKPFVKKMRTLQDVFGYVNDVQMAGQLKGIAADYGEGEDASVAAGYVLARHERKATEAWKDASKKWHALVSSDGFWQ